MASFVAYVLFRFKNFKSLNFQGKPKSYRLVRLWRYFCLQFKMPFVLLNKHVEDGKKIADIVIKHVRKNV